LKRKGKVGWKKGAGVCVGWGGREKSGGRTVPGVGQHKEMKADEKRMGRGGKLVGTHVVEYGNIEAGRGAPLRMDNENMGTRRWNEEGGGYLKQTSCEAKFVAAGVGGGLGR